MPNLTSVSGDNSGSKDNLRVDEKDRMRSHVQDELQRGLDRLVPHRLPIGDRPPERHPEVHLLVSSGKPAKRGQRTKSTLFALVNANNGLMGCSGVSEMIVLRLSWARKGTFM